MDPEESNIPRVPLGERVEEGFDWLDENVSWLFDGIATGISTMYDGLYGALLAVPALLMIVLLALLAWVLRSWLLGVGTALMFLLVFSMELWEEMMQTTALVLIATVIAVVIAIPVGILSAKSRAVSAVVKPILDFMQTMPAFVYLIPTVVLFSIGVVPGMISTVIFALPPGVRMTELGIRQVDGETVEAGESFGAGPWQILRGIQLPLAVPSIMAGINQVIMLALSMGVIAGMTGAPGLGKVVVSAISSLDLALGIEAGLGVVFLAVFLDRLTAALGNPAAYPSSIVALVKKANKARAESKRKHEAEATATA